MEDVGTFPLISYLSAFLIRNSSTGRKDDVLVLGIG